MAIATDAERAQILSVAALGAIGILVILPIPDGSVDAADRLHFLGLYGGIEAGAAVPPAAGIEFTATEDMLEFAVPHSPVHFTVTADKMHFAGRDEDL